MALSKLGIDTSAVEVTNISRHGFWLLVDGTEYFLPFTEFPWFLNVPVAAILEVQRLHTTHFYWPALDVDLELDSIRYPERYPLRADT
jgi:hypothetical protein